MGQTHDLPRGPTPDNPCVRNCCLNEQDVCMGCGRTYQEILNWHRYSQNERQRRFHLARRRLE